MSEFKYLSKTMRKTEEGGLFFFCPGCDGPHRVGISGSAGPVWQWNGCAEKPTLQPSVLVTWSEPAALGDMELLRKQIADKQAGRIQSIPQADKVCHSFVTDGRIQFLNDCTHKLAGQTIDLPPWGWGDE